MMGREKGRCQGKKNGIYDLPCRRAPFRLKKVLPGQIGGPDVLKAIKKKCKENLYVISQLA